MRREPARPVGPGERDLERFVVAEWLDAAREELARVGRAADGEEWAVLRSWAFNAWVRARRAAGRDRYARLRRPSV